MIDWSELIFVIILVAMLVNIFWLLGEIRNLRKVIESYINKDSINKGGKNGGSW